MKEKNKWSVYNMWWSIYFDLLELSAFITAFTWSLNASGALDIL